VHSPFHLARAVETPLISHQVSQVISSRLRHSEYIKQITID